MSIQLIWLIKAALIYGALLTLAAGMTLAERKVSAWIQYRIGPNRVGPWGLLQPLADGVKFIFKEELVPQGANPILFRLSPMLSAVPAMVAVAVIPFAGDLSIGGHETTLSIADIEVSAINDSMFELCSACVDNRDLDVPTIVDRVASLYTDEEATKRTIREPSARLPRCPDERLRQVFGVSLSRRPVLSPRSSSSTQRSPSGPSTTLRMRAPMS